MRIEFAVMAGVEMVATEVLWRPMRSHEKLDHRDTAALVAFIILEENNRHLSTTLTFMDDDRIVCYRAVADEDGQTILNLKAGTGG